MPSARKHLRNARAHQQAALLAAESEVTRAWAAVALFYSAHQLVHAMLDGETILAEELRHPEAHGGAEGTSTIVAQNYRPIAAAYKSLFGTGKAVRYLGATVTSDDFAGLLDDHRVIGKWAKMALTSRGRSADELTWLTDAT